MILINAPTFLERFLGQIGYLGSRLASYPFLQRGASWLVPPKKIWKCSALTGGDIVVTKLNILELSSVCICGFKEEAHATITFLVSQDFLTNILVGEFLTLSTLTNSIVLSEMLILVTSV